MATRRLSTRRYRTRTRFGNSDSEPLIDVARRSHAIHLRREAKRALRKANDNLHRVLKPTYFSAIPLDAIYHAVEATGLTIDSEEKQCILCGRDGRATWPITYQGIPVHARLWITWHKMETTGRYEVIGAIT